MKAMIELADVSKVYGNVTALKQVNLQILEGEVFSLLGPNGSGKTTLLRIMAGIEKPTSGEMRFKGMKVDEGIINEVRLRSTMVFQKTLLFNTSVYNNIAYGLRLRERSKKETEQKIREALKTVKLEGYEKRPAKKLSGGEQQRVALARALALDTEVSLLDEPTANIDPKNVSIIEDVLSWVNKEKKTTMVIATHNMFQAETLAKRSALLLEGKIVKVGSPQEIFTLPSKLLASYARLENVFSGVSKVTREGTSLVNIGDGVQIETAFEKTGNTTVFVRPEDIILSSNPIVSSARNSFEGRIVEVSDLGAIVRLRVKAGRDFTVQITKRSFNDMQLNIDSKVFLAFKASSVQTV
jgi:tungstate transport system ATP-binding protein